MKIAIIGFGLSGFSFLKSLMDKKKDTDEIEIDIYEKRDEYPVGRPYEDDTLDKLLNVDSDEMIFPKDDKDDFKNWLKENNKSPDQREMMWPRVYFGQYLKDRSKAYLNMDKVRMINKEVIDLDVAFEKGVEKYTVYTKDTKDFYDGVFMGTGASFYQDPYFLDGKKGFIRNPYPLREKLKDIKKDQRVAIIGTSASSTDVFRYLEKEKNLNHKVNFFTGSNEYKIVDIPYLKDSDNISSIDYDWIKNEREKNGFFISLENLIKTIRTDFEKQGQELEYAYKTYSQNTLDLSRKAIKKNDQALAFAEDYFMDFAVYQADIYNYLSVLDRKKYMDDFYSYLNFLSGKTPHNTMKWLLKSFDNDKIDIILNTKDIKVNSDNTFTLIGDEKRDADIVINCTGLETRLDKVAQKIPLIKNLYDKNIIMADEEGSCIGVTWPGCNPISKRYGKLKNLYITGMMIAKTDLDNNDARCIQRTAARVGEIFLEKNF